MPMPTQRTLASAVLRRQPCRALQRVALDALNCVGVGVRDALRHCSDLARFERVATHVEDWLATVGRLIDHVISIVVLLTRSELFNCYDSVRASTNAPSK
eukprot:7342594-Lingulodinium_polyedra.AAC.1